MRTNATQKSGIQLQGIYYTDREYAREHSDLLRTVIEATTNLAADAARWSSSGIRPEVVTLHPGVTINAPTAHEFCAAMTVLNRLTRRIDNDAAWVVRRLDKLASCMTASPGYGSRPRDEPNEPLVAHEPRDAEASPPRSRSR